MESNDYTRQHPQRICSLIRGLKFIVCLIWHLTWGRCLWVILKLPFSLSIGKSEKNYQPKCCGETTLWEVWKITSFAWWKAPLVFTVNTWRKFFSSSILQNVFCCLPAREAWKVLLNIYVLCSLWRMSELVLAYKNVTISLSDQYSRVRPKLGFIPIFIF